MYSKKSIRKRITKATAFAALGTGFFWVTLDLIKYGSATSILSGTITMVLICMSAYNSSKLEEFVDSTNIPE